MAGSQSALADSLGEPRSTISAWFGRKPRRATAEQLWTISYVYDVSLDWLFGFSVPMRRTDRVSMTDELSLYLKELDKDIDLKYNKFYIGLARNGQPSNFVVFRPKREWLRLELGLDRTDELTQRLEEAGLDVMEYDAKWGKYRLRLTEGDLSKHKPLVQELMKEAYQASV
jgi:predicted transport protein